MPFLRLEQGVADRLDSFQSASGVTDVGKSQLHLMRLEFNDKEELRFRWLALTAPVSRSNFFGFRPSMLQAANRASLCMRCMTMMVLKLVNLRA